MMAPEETEDLISKKQRQQCLFGRWTENALKLSLYILYISVPKVDQMDKRLGILGDEFRELVYPANYNPDSKPAAKRKTGEEDFSFNCNLFLTFDGFGLTCLSLQQILMVEL